MPIYSPTLKLGLSMPHIQSKQKAKSWPLTCMAMMGQTSLSGSFNQNPPSCIYITKQFHRPHIHPRTDHYCNINSSQTSRQLFMWEAVKLPGNSLCGWTVWYGASKVHGLRAYYVELKKSTVSWCKVTMQFHCFNWIENMIFIVYA